MAYDIGGGGGPSGNLSENTRHALAMPYDISGEPTSEKMNQLQEMLMMLFQSMSFNEISIDDIEDILEDSDEDDDVDLSDYVTGPGSAVDGNLPLFDGVTGKAIGDSGTSLATLLAGEAGVFRVASVPLVSASLAAAATSPITLVAAGGADTILVPISLYLQFNTTVVFSNNPNWHCRYANRGVNLTNAQVMGTTGVNNVIAWITSTNWNPTDVSVYDARNKALVLAASADLTGSGTVNGRAIVIYAVVSTI